MVDKLKTRKKQKQFIQKQNTVSSRKKISNYSLSDIFVTEDLKAENKRLLRILTKEVKMK